MAEKTKDTKVVKKKNSGKFLKFFRDLFSETKKITWPSRKTVINNTLVVIACVLVVGAFIWVLDALLTFLLSLVLGA